MSGYIGFPSIQVLVGPDKESPLTREQCGVRIGAEAPKSELYKTVGEVHDAVDAVVAEGKQLHQLIDEHATAEAALVTAKTALGAGVVSFDRAYNVLVAVAEKHCTTENDSASLALAVQKGTKNPLAMPLGIDAKYIARKDWIRVHVHAAPGTNSLLLEMSLDGINWTEILGDGAIHKFPNPDAGTYWFRALARSARGKSDYTNPVSVTVR